MSQVLPPPILHIAVICFDHSYGNRCEYIYPSPPISTAPPAPGDTSPVDDARVESLSLSSLLPLEWSRLPFLALPDGSHNTDEDYVYFTMPSLSPASSVVYVTSCFKQVPVARGEENDRNIERAEGGNNGSNLATPTTRSFIQKSIVIISSRMVYGSVILPLQAVTRSYLLSQSLSQDLRRDMLIELYSSLNHSLLSHSPRDIQETLFSVVNLRYLLCKLGRGVLRILKAMLLEKAILIYSSSPSEVSTVILALTSLLPSTLLSLSLPSQRDVMEIVEVQEDVGYGLPFQPFSASCPWFPFLDLQSILDLQSTLCKVRLNAAPLTSTSTIDSKVSSPPQSNISPVLAGVSSHLRGYVAGTTALLTVMKPKVIAMDVLVDLSTVGASSSSSSTQSSMNRSSSTIQPAKLSLFSPTVKSQLTLSDWETAFIDSILQILQRTSSKNRNEYVGSEDWIRNEFNFYFKLLIERVTLVVKECAVNNIYNPDLIDPSIPLLNHHFGSAFIVDWKTTENFSRWSMQVAVDRVLALRHRRFQALILSTQLGVGMEEEIQEMVRLNDDEVDRDGGGSGSSTATKPSKNAHDKRGLGGYQPQSFFIHGDDNINTTATSVSRDVGDRLISNVSAIGHALVNRFTGETSNPVVTPKPLPSLSSLFSNIKSKLSTATTALSSTIEGRARYWLEEDWAAQRDGLIQGGAPPWIIYKDEDLCVANDIKQKILGLSLDRQNFLQAPARSSKRSFTGDNNIVNSTVDNNKGDSLLSYGSSSTPTSPSPFDLSLYHPMAHAALKEDHFLQRIYVDLVPSHTSEETFWKNYFLRVKRIRSQMLPSERKKVATITNTADNNGNNSNDQNITSRDGNVTLAPCEATSSIGTGGERVVTVSLSSAYLGPLGSFKGIPASFGPPFHTLSSDPIHHLNNQSSNYQVCEYSLITADPLTCHETLRNRREDLEGRVVVVDRGVCSFFDKVWYAQGAGAAAVIVCNSVESNLVTMTVTNTAMCNPSSILIPSLMICATDADVLRATLSVKDVVVAFDDGERRRRDVGEKRHVSRPEQDSNKSSMTSPAPTSRLPSTPSFAIGDDDADGLSVTPGNASVNASVHPPFDLMFSSSNISTLSDMSMGSAFDDVNLGDVTDGLTGDDVDTGQTPAGHPSTANPPSVPSPSPSVATETVTPHVINTTATSTTTTNMTTTIDDALLVFESGDFGDLSLMSPVTDGPSLSLTDTFDVFLNDDLDDVDQLVKEMGL